MADARSEFRISTSRLDEEWLAQPELMHEYCVRLADSKQQLNEAKASFELVQAEADRDVRLHPSRYGIDKLSEKRIEGAVVLTAQYQEAYKEMIERQHDHDVLNAAVSALENKKRALENLVHLFSMDYFSQPKTSEESYEAMREQKRDRALRGARTKKGV